MIDKAITLHIRVFIRSSFQASVLMAPNPSTLLFQPQKSVTRPNDDAYVPLDIAPLRSCTNRSATFRGPPLDSMPSRNFDRNRSRGEAPKILWVTTRNNKAMEAS